MTDAAILKALSRGLTTSTEIAERIKLPVERTQNALNRLLDAGRVVRTKDATGYIWSVL